MPRNPKRDKLIVEPTWIAEALLAIWLRLY
jgi:hypothetical protein